MVLVGQAAPTGAGHSAGWGGVPSNLMGMSLRRLAGVVGASLALLVWSAAPALAAPTLLSADPEEGAELHEAPERVTLTFSEPLDESSEIRVFDDCDRRLDDRATMIDLNEMSVGIELTPSGTYTVAYVAAGISGTTQSSYSFTVLHAGPACDGGGGHGDHGGHGGGDDGDGGGHGGHGGGDGDGGDHGAHGGDGHDGDHVSAAPHAGHGGPTTKGHDGHGGKDHAGHGGGKKGGDEVSGSGSDAPPLAAGETDLFPEPGGGAVVLALGIAMLLGVLGGWALRLTTPQ